MRYSLSTFLIESVSHVLSQSVIQPACQPASLPDRHPARCTLNENLGEEWREAEHCPVQTPYMLHLTPSILHLTTPTFHPSYYTLHPAPYTWGRDGDNPNTASKTMHPARIATLLTHRVQTKRKLHVTCTSRVQFVPTETVSRPEPTRRNGPSSSEQGIRGYLDHKKHPPPQDLQRALGIGLL
jgi:hypothetical protein